jgi:hypothetical protein
MGCSWFNTETNKKKTSINNKNMQKVTLLLVRWVIAYVLAFLWFINSILELSP